MPITENLLSFLRQIRKNNNKTWFNKHKGQFKDAENEFKAFVGGLAQDIAMFDPLIRDSLENPKTVKVFRIYRDLRFSKDKSPYKSNFGGLIVPDGMVDKHAMYFVHIEPGKSFIGGGYHSVPSKALDRIRQSIVHSSKSFRNLLRDKEFLRYFKGLDRENPLKAAPRGYPTDHPDLDLLQLRSFTVHHRFRDQELLADGIESQIIDMFKQVYRLNVVLNKAMERHHERLMI